MSTLSREQVERAYIGLLNDASIKGQIGLTTTIVLLSAHDANLRALLRQREEALDLVKATCDSKDWYMARQGESFEALRQHGIMLDAQLAAMTAERASIQAQLTTCHGIITAQETTIVIMESRLDGLAQEVSRSQLRINKLEDKLKLCTLTPERPPA